MMSTAILMTAGAEQTKASLVPADLSSDQGELGGVSFAKSFQERAGVSVSSQEKSTAVETVTALPVLMGTTLTKQQEEVAGRSSELKGEPNTAQKIFVHSELKAVAVGQITQPKQTTVTGVQEKTSTDDVETVNVDPSAQVDGTANHALLPSPIAYATPGSDARAESLGPQVSAADGDQSPVSNGDRPEVQKKTETTDKMIEGASSKEIAKTQKSLATAKTVQKTGGKIGGVTEIEPKSVTGISTESAISLVGQQVAPMAVLQGEISKATDPLSEAASAATKPATGVSPTALDGQVPTVVTSGTKAGVSGAKAGVIDTAMMVTAESDPIVSPKADMSPEKVPAGPMPRGSDAENKPQAVQGAGTVLLHSMGLMPAPVVGGVTAAELGATKLQAADTGSHTAASATGLREQGGAVAVVQSMDAAPRMLLATPTSLEVGIQNGTHGWLKVRAEMTDAGVVNASVSATSSAGQEMLHRELPALTAYLQEEKVGVNAVIVHASSAAGTDARGSSGTEGAGGQTPQRSNEGGEQDQNLRKATLNDSEKAATYRSLHGFDEDGSLPLAAYVSGGSWLSVRA